MADSAGKDGEIPFPAPHVLASRMGETNKKNGETCPMLTTERGHQCGVYSFEPPLLEVR